MCNVPCAAQTRSMQDSASGWHNLWGRGNPASPGEPNLGTLAATAVTVPPTDVSRIDSCQLAVHQLLVRALSLLLSSHLPYLRGVPPGCISLRHDLRNRHDEDEMNLRQQCL